MVRLRRGDDKLKKLAVLAIAVALAGCQRSPDQVFDKVLIDFGVRDKPEGYETASDKVYQRLDAVGMTEMKRLNMEERKGEVKFQQNVGLSGKYYKEVKVYERFYPVKAVPITKKTQDGRGYYGYIDYNYRFYQSARKSSRTEAAAQEATISTDVTGRDRYRYKFGAGGTWNRGNGERVRN